MGLTKLLGALAPLIVALATQMGIEITEAQVTPWIEFCLWLSALAGTLFPSFRAWWNHREGAE